MRKTPKEPVIEPGVLEKESLTSHTWLHVTTAGHKNRERREGELQRGRESGVFLSAAKTLKAARQELH